MGEEVWKEEDETAQEGEKLGDVLDQEAEEVLEGEENDEEIIRRNKDEIVTYYGKEEAHMEETKEVERSKAGRKEEMKLKNEKWGELLWNEDFWNMGSKHEGERRNIGEKDVCRCTSDAFISGNLPGGT